MSDGKGCGFATKADLDAGFAGLRGDVCRALWVQGGALAVVMVVLVGLGLFLR